MTQKEVVSKPSLVEPPTNGQGNVVVPDKWTARVLPVTYESNDLRTVASMPNEHKLCKMIKCKM